MEENMLNVNNVIMTRINSIISSSLSSLMFDLFSFGRQEPVLSQKPVLSHNRNIDRLEGLVRGCHQDMDLFVIKSKVLSSEAAG